MLRKNSIIERCCVLCHLVQYFEAIKSLTSFIFYEMNVLKICDCNRGSLPHMLGVEVATLQVTTDCLLCFVFNFVSRLFSPDMTLFSLLSGTIANRTASCFDLYHGKGGEK